MAILIHFLFSIQIVFGIFVIYLILRLLVYQSKTAINKRCEPISIVIPFRDEAHNLAGLLESLAQQTYESQFEIVLVNDQSTDDYSAPISSFKDKYPNTPLILIDSIFNESVNLTSKQQAIETGIKQASYDWIALTDADMHLTNLWLTILNSSKDGSISLVYGHTIINATIRSFFNTLQSFQLEFLFVTAYAFFTAKLHGSCMGNNMLLSKKMYYEIGGQSGIGYSIVEDRDLLTVALKKGYGVTPTIPFYPSAETIPSKTISQFFQQTLRWLKGSFRHSQGLVPAIVLLGIQNLILLLSILGILPGLLLWASIVNAGLLMIFSSVGLQKTGSKENILFFPLYYGFMIIESILLVLPLLFMTPRWKRRSL